VILMIGISGHIPITGVVSMGRCNTRSQSISGSTDRCRPPLRKNRSKRSVGSGPYEEGFEFSISSRSGQPLGLLLSQRRKEGSRPASQRSIVVEG
jgi:hypothetical protein